MRWPKCVRLFIATAPSPILFHLTPHSGRRRVPELEPFRRPSGTIARSQSLGQDAFRPSLQVCWNTAVPFGCAMCSFRRTPGMPMLRKVEWQRGNASRGPPPDYVFFFGRSARSSRNSPGPFRSRRFLCCCSSAVADGSASLSICWPARSMAFDVAFGLRRFMSCDPASPSSTSRRMASERSGLSVCLAAQASTFSRNSDESRIAVTGSRPVAGRPLFFRTTFLRDAFIFLVLPKEATTTCPKDRGRACGMGVRGQSWRASATTTAAPITSAARFSPRGPLGISNLYVWNHVEKGRITPASDF